MLISVPITSLLGELIY